MNSRNPGAGDERGLALVMSVLFLLLAGVLAIGSSLRPAASSSLSSNVHTAKGALCAADAGIRVTEQKLANMAALRRWIALTKNWSGGPVIPPPATFFPVGTISSSSTSPNFTATAKRAVDGQHVDGQFADLSLPRHHDVHRQRVLDRAEEGC